jgi:hypothetical protein
MEMKKVNCAKCGKSEMMSVEQATKCLSYEQAEQKLLKRESTPVHLCDECVGALEAFRKTLKN